MNSAVPFIDRVLGFAFEHGAARKFEEVGAGPGDIQFWFRNAQVYDEVTKHRKPREEERVRLLALIETIRVEAMGPPLNGESHDFDVSTYEFSEDVLAYKPAVIKHVLQQEAESPSDFDGL